MKRIIPLMILGLLFFSLTKTQAAEQQVWFTPMAVAYKTNPAEAREIAIKYLNESLKEFSSFETYKLCDKEGKVQRAVDLIHNILISENKIEPAERFEQNLNFMDLIEQVLVKAKEQFAQLKESPEYIDGINSKKYIQDTLEYCIREWILIREDIIAHEDDSLLQLSIKSNKQVYEPGDDVIVELKLENMGKLNITICNMWLPTLNVGLWVTYNGKEIYPIPVKYPVVVLTKENFVELHPGGNIIKKLNISAYIPTNKIGIYNFRLSYANNNEGHYDDSANKYKDIAWHGSVTSNTITIEVKEKKDISKEEAIKLGNDYMKRHYGTNFSLKYITKPSEIFEAKDGWIITYAEKEPRTIPSGVVLKIDKKTGEVRLLPQE